MGIWDSGPVVSLRSTTGYFLASRRLARKRPAASVKYLKPLRRDFF
jgi:hypothetical protein